MEPISKRLITPPVADLEVLYGQVDSKLREIVAFNVRGPEGLIEDACQTAWLRLARRRDRLVPRAVLPWLVTTATREALRLVRRAERDLPFEVLGDPDPVASAAPGPDALAEWRSRLAELRALPPRQQRFIWLQGLGFSYSEMAGREGASLRTVERQVLRARGALAPG